jgi:hypothetical protein
MTNQALEPDVRDMWPLHVAIAWICTRDLAFVSFVSGLKADSFLKIDIALADHGSEHGQEYSPDEAWERLRKRLGTIYATGIRFGQRGTSGAVSTPIPWTDVGLNQIDFDHNTLSLVVHPGAWGYRDVYVSRDDVIAAFPAPRNAALAGTMPPRGVVDGGWNVADVTYFREMHTLIKDGRAGSITEAARQVAAQARGAGTLDSKSRRLQRGFQKWKASAAID